MLNLRNERPPEAVRDSAPSASALLPQAWWGVPAELLLASLSSRHDGLDDAEAAVRLERHGGNELRARDNDTPGRLLLRQFQNPLVLILVAAAALSFGLREWLEAGTIVLIVGASALLGFWQELRASIAVQQLRGRLALTARVRRSGGVFTRLARDLVPGDIVELAAGNLVPADGLVLASNGLLVDQASLTGESAPVEKTPGVAPADALPAGRANCVFLGTAVRSGTGTVLLVNTGATTVMGDLAARLAVADEQTEFERGVRRFGEMLLRVMFCVVVAVLVFNQLLDRPAIESLLFALALAVGLSPELMPAIVGVSLARGARRLAAHGVLVRRMDAIEDLGGVDVLCTDKTGTLTQGSTTLERAVDADGNEALEVLRLAFLNASFQAGVATALDSALVDAGTRAGLATTGWSAVDELPFDFERRCSSVVLASGADAGRQLLVCKGAVDNVLARCTLDDAERERHRAFASAAGERGVRVLALATREFDARTDYGANDEQALRCIGFLCFSDPLKPDAVHALRALAARGTRVKLITGDNRHVACHVAQQVGLDTTHLLDGAALATVSDDALPAVAERTTLFVEVDPAQKERIVHALQRGGHAVAFLGDGINDAPALRRADVGISVDTAVDVARESADVLLLRRDLALLQRGISEGRRTFANTLKYIQITMSANFGNMISMALVTPVLPFLPLTAAQILLNNFLSDIPLMAISADRVDESQLRHVQRWHQRQVWRFMIVFGLVSSLFDLAAFALLRLIFAADAAAFRTAWFVESLMSELAILLVLRTQGPAWQARPRPLLAGATLAIAVVAVALPYAGLLADVFGLVPLPAPMLGAMLALVLAYAAVNEWTKRWFWRQDAAAPAHAGSLPGRLVP
jgi:Mg2+-importing ATPase